MFFFHGDHEMEATAGILGICNQYDLHQCFFLEYE